MMTSTSARQPLDTTAASPPSSMWTATRLVILLFTFIDALLFARFALKLFDADATQSLVSTIYRTTEPLIVPFRGMLAEPAGPPVVDIQSILAMLFYALVAALVAGIVHALTRRRGEGFA